VEHSPERELKLAATPDFRMPSVYGLVGPIVRQAPPERNDTTYYDTEDLRLARGGASLRHRPGEGWTVKLPAERSAPYLVRPEIVFEGPGGSPPAAALELVRSFIRHEDVHESVRMTTIRRRTGLHDTNGTLIAGVVDDAVSVVNGNGPSAFRELEVEIGGEMSPGLLDALVERLRLAGAGGPEQTAKYIRALASPEPLVPEISVPDLGADATAGAVAQRAIALSVIRLILHDPVVRVDVDPEGVHQTRVATRRLRSDLRTFRPLLDREWARALRDELGWIAEILGEVRDGDVLLERLRRRADELPADDRTTVERVLATMRESRDAAHAGLLETLRQERYVALLDRLVEAANAPVCVPAAGEPAREAIPKLVRRPWHRLAKRAKTLGDEPSNEQLHELRIRTKRVRYAAEAAAPIVGKPARAFANVASALQDVLGDLNDSVVAARWLDDWASRNDDAAAKRAAESLSALEQAAVREQRTLWRAALDELSDPELRAWM
jgi:CHAD domain-containing protein